MPYVKIQVTREGVTTDQKKRLIEGATRLLTDVLGKVPQMTYVVIQEIETENWGTSALAEG
jgi:4-oxalocrotonate tautomerase